MNAQERQIIQAALTVLHEREGSVTDTQLHAEVKMRVSPPPLLGPYETAMRLADAMKLVIGVPAKFGGGTRWTITDQGEAALIEMGR
jgi:hypothetical protein